MCHGAHWRDDGGGLLIRHDASDADDVRLGDERHEAHDEEVLHELPRGRREADADAAEGSEDDREGALGHVRSACNLQITGEWARSGRAGGYT